MSASEIQAFQKPVVYQIYPRSFQDSNGDGIGDLPGIISRLDYLQMLGVDFIWLSPIYVSPNDDNGYDISDYRAISPDYGTLEDFDRLLSAAQERGIKIMMDLVVNHTSDEHHWFTQSQVSRDNPYRDYYIWKDPAGFDDDGTPLPPNNWVSAFSASAWQWHEQTGQFYLHMFSPKQPDLNWENPAVRREVYDIMRFWLDRGVAGFRMDVINLISKDGAYADDPAVAAGSREPSLAMVANGPRVHEFLREMNREVLAHYDVLTVGETPCVSTGDALLYAGFDRGELQMIFQFEHMDVDASTEGLGKWSDTPFRLTDLKQVLTKWQQNLDSRAWNSLYWNNHDQPRAVSRFGNDSPAWRKISAKMLAVALHCMQGTPYIYQGEELGMTNVYFETVDQYNDLEIHDVWAKYVDSGRVAPQKMLGYISASGRDNARTPMQWSAEKNAGFTTGTPWLSVNPRYREINAEEALADKDSVFYFYRQLLRLRRENPVMISGRFEPIEAGDPEAVFAYLRRGVGSETGQNLTVLCNFSDTAQILDPAALSAAGSGHRQLLISNYPDDEGDILRPYEAKVYRVETDASAR